MIKVAICDNDANEVAKIRKLIADFEDFRIYTYIDPLKLCKDTTAGKRFHLYLLDIVMPEMDGLSLAAHIRETDETAFIFFLTSHDSHSLAAFGVRAFQYILKPINVNYLFKELRFVREFISQRDQTSFSIKNCEGITVVPFYKIVYCYVENRCIICIDNDGRTTKSSTIRVPFSQMIAPLLSDSSFAQTHISYVVNLNSVKSLQGHSFLMKDLSVIPISQKYYKTVKERYLTHVFGGE